MHIWVDADGCPTAIKDLLYRAADRWGIALTLVANHPLRIPPSPHIRVLQVPAGFDVADHTIVQHVQTGDLVVTADIPLAAQVIAQGAYALNPRGHVYTRENIHEHLTRRQVLDELRQRGVHTGGPAPFSPRDRQAFANQLHRVLTHDGTSGSSPAGDERDARRPCSRTDRQGGRRGERTGASGGEPVRPPNRGTGGGCACGDRTHGPSS